MAFIAWRARGLTYVADKAPWLLVLGARIHEKACNRTFALRPPRSPMTARRYAHWIGMMVLALTGGSLIAAGASIVVGSLVEGSAERSFLAWGAAGLAVGCMIVRLAIRLGRRVYTQGARAA